MAYSSVNGADTQILTHAYPLWEFELTYESLRTQTQNIIPYTQWPDFNQYERIAAVFLACRGQYGRFYYRDHSDSSRTLQFIDVGNGVRKRFRMIRSFGQGDLVTFEPVGGVDLGTAIPIIYVGGTPQPTGWYIDATDNQTLVFDTAPVGTIAAKFYFYYYCRFLEDLTEFSEFMRNLHQLGRLRFRSVKDCDETSPNAYPFSGSETA